MAVSPSPAELITAAWYKRGILAWALFPLSLLFGALAGLRRLAFRLGWKKSQKLPVPVLVVGNVTVGGAGKTPLTLWLAQRLRDEGLRPGIVSRGYGGTVAQAGGVAAVSADSDCGQVGDEPLLLARRSGCPVWVGRNRVAAGRALLAAHPEVNLILTDDGLQHYRLARDVEVVVMDGRGAGNGWLLPAGPLREPLSRIRRTQALVINGAKLPPEVVGLAPTYRMSLTGRCFYRLDAPDVSRDAAEFVGLNLHAVAGIGHPQRFFDHLADLGLQVTPHAFADHHDYRAGDLDFGPGSVTLMTEKDAVKCPALARPDTWVLRVDAQLAPDLAPRLLEILNGRPAA